MAKPKSKPIDGEYVRPDVERAFQIHRQSIAPKLTLMAEKRGDMKEPWSEIKEECHYPKKVLEFLLFVDALEDTKSEYYKLCVALGAEHLGWSVPSDLVTQAQGIAGDNIIPSSKRDKPRLVTVSDGTETDLADVANEVDAFDAADPALQAAE